MTLFLRHPFHAKPRTPIRDRLQLTVIENETGKRVCSFPSRIDLALDHLEFETEAWNRAVREKRVMPADRSRYSIELR